MESDVKLLSSQVADLSKRLSRIEDKLFGPEPSPRVTTKVTSDVVHTNAAQVQDNTSKADTKVREPIGGRLLGFAAVICFVSAGAFLIRLAIESGWLTPVRQLYLAGLFGLALIYIGTWLKRKDLAYATLLPSAGVIILWMCIFAGHRYLQVLSPIHATLLGLLLSAFCFFLFTFFRHGYFLMVAVVGVYMMPLLFQPFVFPGSAYFLAWDVLFTFLAVRLGSRGIICLAAYFSLGLFFILSEAFPSPESGREFSDLLIQALQFGIFLMGTTWHTITSKRPLTSGESFALAPVLLLFYATEYAWLLEVNRDFAPWAGLGFAALLIGAQQYAERTLAQKLPSRGMVASVVSLILLHAGCVELLPASAMPWLGLFFMALWPTLESKGFKLGDYPVPVLIYWGIIVVQFMEAFSETGWNEGAAPRVFFNVAYAAIVHFAYFRNNPSKSEHSIVLLGMGSAQAVVALEQLATRIGTTDTVPYYVSALVAVYAFTLMVAAKHWEDRRAALIAMLIFLGVSFKVLVQDLAESAPLVRVLTLMAVGALLYGGGLISRQINKTTST